MSSWKFGAGRRKGVGWRTWHGDSAEATGAVPYYGSAGAEGTAWFEQDEAPPQKVPRLDASSSSHAGLYARQQQEGGPAVGVGYVSAGSSAASTAARAGLSAEELGSHWAAAATAAAGVEAPVASPSPEHGSSGGGGRGPVEGVVAEVLRIVRCKSSADYRQVLGLPMHEACDLQAVQSRYRQLMRLLHPDKRRVEDEARAGGRDVCDEAVRRVQRALESARGSSSPTASASASAAAWGAEAPPRSEAPALASLRRMQEIQRQQARQAMQRLREGAVGGGSMGAVWRTSEPPAASPVEPPASAAAPGLAPSAEDLLKDITEILAGGLPSAVAGAPPADPQREPATAGSAGGSSGGATTTSQLIDLLAGLR